MSAQKRPRKNTHESSGNELTVKDGALRIERLKWSNVLRHTSLPLISWAVVKKWDGRYKGQSSFLLQVRYNMETVLIVLVVLFVLGGGGWGYSRWRG